MSDYDGVQVSGQKDAGKCSPVQLVTVTKLMHHSKLSAFLHFQSFCMIYKLVYHGDLKIFP